SSRKTPGSVGKIMTGRYSQLTRPDRTYLLRKVPPARSLNSAQCGQLIDPNSTSFSGALGLPIRKPPCGVAATSLLQSWVAAGRAAGLRAGVFAGLAALSTAGSAKASSISKRGYFIRQGPVSVAVPVAAMCPYRGP